MRRFLAFASLALALAAPAAIAQEGPRAAATAADPSYVYPPDPEYTYATKRLNRAELDALFASPESVLVVDVRRPDELTRVGGFPVYLSVQADSLGGSLAWLPKDRSIVVVSNRAHRAGAAGDLLAQNGFAVAGAIGVRDYEEQGGTIVRIAPPAD